MDEKVMKYRKKHRRCKYCLHKILNPSMMGLTPEFYSCQAKDKIFVRLEHGTSSENILLVLSS